MQQVSFLFMNQIYDHIIKEIVYLELLSSLKRLIVIIFIILVMLSNLMHVQLFHWQMVNSVKILLFLAQKIFRLYILIIEKSILVLDEGPRHGLDDTTITPEAKHSFNITKSKKICLSLNYNENNNKRFWSKTKCFVFG